MYLTLKDLKKHFLFVLFFIWGILFLHLFYVYLQTLWKPQAIRWWVFLEWVIWHFINPLPYMWNNYYSKYTQSFLYKACLNDDLTENLCTIKTNDNKTFVVSLSWTNYRSDWTLISLDDIYFTYKNVIQDNSLQLASQAPNSVESITKNENNITLTFQDPSVNNNWFFTNYILPAHILKDKTKDYYTSEYFNKFVNSTCVTLNPKSDFKNNIILDFKDCPDYYINSYQFVLLNDIGKLSRFLTWANKIDIYWEYDNIEPNIFEELNVRKKLRYWFFWNVQRQTDSDAKSFLSHQILSHLQEDINISSMLNFNGYGLFLLPENKITKQEYKDYFLKNIVEKEKEKFEANFNKLAGNTLNYKFWENNKYYVPKPKSENIIISWNIGSGWYTKLWISQNSSPEYFPTSYNWKTFKYVLSSSFKNIKKWENTYTLYVYDSAGKRKKLDEIKLYYQDLEYPEFTSKAQDFILVYLDDGLIAELGDAIAPLIKKYYPWNVQIKKVQLTEYNEILKSWNYDMVVWNVNFDWKDISLLFKTKDPLSNPSLFASPSFASLINQNLLVSLDYKNDLFQTLNKMYQDSIPIVFIWNEKFNLFINKKYNIDKQLDYSSYKNRREMIKSIIINEINKPVRDDFSFSSMIDFIKKWIWK